MDRSYPSMRPHRRSTRCSASLGADPDGDPRLPEMVAPILVVSGCSAVGKSTVSHRLARALDPSVHLPVDVLLRLFDDPFPDPASPDGAHRYEVVGAAAGAAAAQFARGGFAVILDGPIFPAGVRGLAEIGGRRGVDVHYAVLRADLDTCLARSRQQNGVGPPDLAEFGALHARFAELGPLESHVIDASGTSEQVAASILAAFTSGGLALKAPDSRGSA